MDAKLLMTYIREYLAICGYLERTSPQKRTKASLFIEQDKLVALLDRNRYEESQTKLTVWRNLQWIDCEPERFSRKTRIDGRQTRMVHLRRSVYEQLRDFFGGNSTGNIAGNKPTNTSAVVPSV